MTQPALRDRIAAALYERERPPRDPQWPDAYAADREVFEAMADAVLPVLSQPADRATVLREAADRLADEIMRGAQFSDEDARQPGLAEAVMLLRRWANGEPPAKRPCSVPNPCEDGELCARHEEEQAHAEGEHQYCSIECEANLPSEQLRNAILCRAIPGSKNMLAELERRAAVRGCS
jgi:hypothetical protein